MGVLLSPALMFPVGSVHLELHARDYLVHPGTMMQIHAQDHGHASREEMHGGGLESLVHCFWPQENLDDARSKRAGGSQKPPAGSVPVPCPLQHT